MRSVKLKLKLLYWLIGNVGNVGDSLREMGT